MKETLEKIEKEMTLLETLNKKHDELLKQQEKILSDFYQKNTPIIKLIIEKGFIFTHPTLKWTSSRGPILGYDEKERDLYFFSYDKGIIKYNTITKEESFVFFRQIVKLGMFETAYEGIAYVENMISDYIAEMTEIIDSLAKTLINK